MLAATTRAWYVPTWVSGHRPVTSPIALIGLEREEMVPVGGRLHADPFDGHGSRSTPSSRWMPRSERSYRPSPSWSRMMPSASMKYSAGQ
jgi:hypothetical protein